MRKEIAYFHDDLEAILEEKDFKREFGDFDRNEKDTLKNPPRGYDKEHPAIELLKLKSFESSQKIEFSAAAKKDFVAVMSQKLIVLKPLNDFINRALTSE
jgi:uncharacterized protein (DUF2461 family)